MATQTITRSFDIHIESDEKKRVDALRDLCSEKGSIERASRLASDDVVDGVADDATLLRFLRGNASGVKEAFRQFEDALDLRDTVNANSFYDESDITDFEDSRALYPHWTGRRDKRGLPICLFDLACIDANVVGKYNHARTIPTHTNGKETPKSARQAVVFHDYLTRFVLPLCNFVREGEQKETTVTSAIYLADVSKLTMKQGWSIRTFCQELSALLATCYPEVIDKIYVTNAPYYFGTVWSIIKKMLDPRTASKVVILSQAEAKSSLAAVIDLENIPTQFGGSLDFQHGMLPMLDDEMQKHIQWATSVVNSELPVGPLKFVEENGQRSIVAVGKQNGKARREQIGVVSQ